MALPEPQGLYTGDHEHDACGVGFLVHLKGRKSHQLVRDSITALNNLNHRGACGCEPNTGDGAGLLIQIPHAFYSKVCRAEGFALPEAGEYGTGILFTPQSEQRAAAGRRLFEEIAETEGQRILGWRRLPVDNAGLGAGALAVEPAMWQVFVAPGETTRQSDAFERKLYVIRRLFEKRVRAEGGEGAGCFYFPSLSCCTVVYKGMLTPPQVDSYFLDLRDPDLTSALCLFHSRFSTNTFPAWELAHPYRMIAHNGEINTKRGNINWMRARQSLLRSTLFEPGDIEKLLPVIADDHASDTAVLDNAVELLIKGGRTPAHAMMMLIPEAWEHHETMSPEKRDFYEFHSCFMEPWDGPASVGFTDGKTIGATLDRNGLRPSRYWVTRDDLVIMASEVGVLPVAPEDILVKGRLEPGRMFLVSMEEGRIIGDDELKHKLASAHPYGDWLRRHRLELSDLPAGSPAPAGDPATLLPRQQAFGYTLEDQKYVLGPMAINGLWAIGSMGTDTPLAVLSSKPQPLFNYFKQLFAQVTNPPLDCIREEVITSVNSLLGPHGNLLEPAPEAAHRIAVENFVIDNDEMARLKVLDHWNGFHSLVLPCIFRANSGPEGLAEALDQLCRHAADAIRQGANILILSDREINREWAPIPSLLATSAVHHYLVNEELRTHCELVVESGDAREVHHFCLLLGYGAGVINPYMAFESLEDMQRNCLLPANLPLEKARKNYIKAVYKGVVKVMAKMGISTVASYRGAQIFEAIGLNRAFIDRYFTHTATQVEGIGLEEVCRELLLLHEAAYPERPAGPRALPWGGQFQWRRDGEYHLFNPETVFRLQHATRTGQWEIFKSYTRRIDDQSRDLCTLRGLMEFRRPEGGGIPIEEVEPIEAIVRRFCTGAMSYGSISEEAHTTLAIAMNRLGGWSNTGEGGEDASRFIPDPDGTDRRSRIKQVASGRFGVTSQYLVSADELQIKMAQGAKPGEGGELPGHKVYPWIARVRGTTPGVGLISPPPHHDIYSIEDLAQLIYDLKNGNPRARICVKLVSEIGVGTVAAGVSKAHADVVLISGHDGGTGASPLTSIKYAGAPWELGLAETQQTLVLNKLRDRIVVQADGQLKTGRDVAIAALLGAEEFGFATAPLVVMGCIMMRVCHLDTCPVGVATQNPELRSRFTGKAEHVIHFFRFIAQELREIMAELGFRTVEEMVGRSDMLDAAPAVEHYKARGLDFSRVLYRPQVGPEVGVSRRVDQDHGLEQALDMKLLAHPDIRAILDLPVQVNWCPAVQDDRGFRKIENIGDLKIPTAVIEMPIRNVDRTVGAILGSEITRKFGGEALPENCIQLRFRGSAGQSFGAFVPHGISLTLDGDANDYSGKGLSGGLIVVRPPQGSPFAPEAQVIIGNVALYGATSGRLFARGRAGERFCVRNSGAQAVVEGAGDHCCEYMTGGIAVVIGPVGRNFGAGMSGGMAFVLDDAGNFETHLNTEMVALEPFEDAEDQALVRELLQQHLDLTGSSVAEGLLKDWPAAVRRFRKVMPVDYKRVLQEQKEQRTFVDTPAV